MKMICYCCCKKIPKRKISGYKHDHVEFIICNECLYMLEACQYFPSRGEWGEFMNNDKEIMLVDNNRKQMDKIGELRQLFYDMLLTRDETTPDPKGNSATLSQEMGVNISQNMTKDKTINIFQMGKISQETTANVVKGLEIIDQINRIQYEQASIKKLEVQEAEVQQQELTIEHLVQVIEWLAEKELSLKAFDFLVRSIYGQTICNNTGSSIKAAKVLGCSQSFASQLSRNFRDGIPDLDNKDTLLELLPQPQKKKVKTETEGE